MSRPRLTVRTRLTLLYTGLFAACGAIVVAVSYTLLAHLRATGQSQLSVTVTIPSAGAPAQGTGIQATEGPGVPRPG